MPSSRITPGGTAITARAINLTNWTINAATAGTDTTPGVTTTYYTSIYIRGDTLVTNVGVLLGSTLDSGSGKVILALYDEGGTLLANTALAGTTTGSTAAIVLPVALTVPYLVTGPRYLIVASQWNDTSDRFRSVPAQCHGGMLGGSQTGTVFGTLPAPLTISATAFTADKANIIVLS